MKKIINILIILMFTGFIACDPQEDNSHTLGSLPQDDELSFDAIPTTENKNIIQLKNTSKVPGIVTWNFGNGGTAKGETARALYPEKGSWTVTMTLYVNGGTVSKSRIIQIDKDDPSLYDTEGFRNLTGGITQKEGKTWVFDQYHLGHFAVGPTANLAEMWWPCPPNGKDGTSLYTQEFTFFQEGTKLVWKNNGYVYAKEAAKNDLDMDDFIYNPAGKDDYDVRYELKASYTYSLKESAEELTLSPGAFFGFYLGGKDKEFTYKIIKLTKDELYVRAINSFNKDEMWYFRLIPKEENIKPIIPLRAVLLKETFENEKPSVKFIKEEMGPSYSVFHDNNWPEGVNTSKKVCLYQKTSFFYSNINFVATGYKFDLTTQNKIRMKVYIPGNNDYSGKLKPQVAVKLQNSELGSDAWRTQEQIVITEKEGIVKDKWVDVLFDFSKLKNGEVIKRTDFDKIVIQFGDEGHDNTGIFYFDEFKFEN